MLSHWKTAMNNGIRSVFHVLTVCFPCIFHVFCMYCVNGPVKTNVFLVLTEPENCRIIERILEFTGKKTTEKEWILTGKREKILGKCRIFES